MTENNSGARIHYRLTFEEWSEVWSVLRPAEIKILYHLRTLDPFGDRELEIKVRELGRELGMSHSTVSRALKVLDAKDYIDLSLLQVNVKVKSQVVSPGTTGVSRHHQRSSDTTSDREAPPSDSGPTAEPLSSEAIQPFSTETQNLPEQTLKNSVKQNSGATPTPTPEPLDKKGSSDVFALVPERAGVPLNAALEAVIRKIVEKYPDEAEERVCNAISAYLEQQETVINPQAYLSAALQRGFTSNTSKKRSPKKTEKQKRTNLPPAPADLSDVIAEIMLQCQRLEMSPQEAVERFGRKGRSLSDLSEMDLATLRREMAEW